MKMIYLLNIFQFEFIIIMVAFQRTEGYDNNLLPCQTPDDVPGYCLPIRQCSNYIEYLRPQFNRNGLESFLRESVCGNRNEQRICCDEAMLTAMSFHGTDEYISNLDKRGVGILGSLKCGRHHNSKIAYGQETKVEEFPWMVLIEYNGMEPICGGSLISHRYVLTAAHCLQESFNVTGVILGEQNLDTDPDCEMRRRQKHCALPRERFDIEKIIRHHNYSRYNIMFDVGLIKISTTVQFKNHIAPICLPITPFSKPLPEYFIIAGWGITEKNIVSRKLRKAFVSYRDHSVCKKAFRLYNINNQNLCIGGDGPTDNCKGDSGGPLFYSVNYLPYQGRVVQYGIVSFGGKNCADLNKSPSLYTNVMEFMPWITSNIDE